MSQLRQGSIMHDVLYSPATTEATMFEFNVKDQTAVIVVEPRVFQELTSSNVGVNPELVREGANTYSWEQAAEAVSAIDRALRGCAKHFRSRFIAQRNSFVLAFGPEAEQEWGVARK